MKTFRAILLICLVLTKTFASSTFGPGGTYATKALAFAADTPGPGDVFEWQAATLGGSGSISEDLSVSQSGSSGNPITIQVRPGDTCVNNGNGSTANMVNLSGQDNITYSGWTATNYAGGIFLLTSGTDGIVLQNMTLWNTLITGASPPAGQDKTVLTVTGGGDGMILSNLYCDTGPGDQALPAQTDIMIIFNMKNLIMEQCTLIQQNATSDGDHNDCLQLDFTSSAAAGANPKLRRSYFLSKATSGTRQHQGVFVECYNVTGDANNNTDYGTTEIYNCVIAGFWGSYGLSGEMRAQAPQTEAAIMKFKIWNNLLHSSNLSGSQPLRINMSDGDPGAGITVSFVNNIFYNGNSSAGAGPQFPIGASGVLTCGTNMYYIANSSVNGSSATFRKGGTSYTWANWQAQGYDVTGSYGWTGSAWTEATFTDAANWDFAPLSGSSPQVGVGMNLASLFTTDINNLTRTIPWNMGPFESDGGGSDPSPSPTKIIYGGILGSGTYQ